MGKLSLENLQSLYARDMAMSFNGTTRSLSLALALITPPFSVLIRFRVASATTRYGLFSVDDGATNSNTPGYVVQLSDTAGRLSASSGNGATTGHATTANSFTANTWRTATAMFDSNSLRRCCLDGGPEASDTTTINPAGLVKTQVGVSGAGDEFLSGFIGSLWIWKISLTTAESLDLHNGKFPGLVRPDYIISAPRMIDLFDPYSGLKWTNNAGSLRVGQPQRYRTPRTHRPFLAPAGTTYPVNTSDSAAATDAAAAAKVSVRPTSDTITLSDLATRGGSTWVRAASDSITASDLAAGGRLISCSASDLVSATDLAARTVTFNRTASDTTAATDAAARVGTLNRPATDTAAATDAASAAKTSVRTASDSAAATDAASAAKTSVRNASDTATASDSASRAGSVWVRSASDTLIVSDSPTGIKGAVVSASDSAAATDAAARSGSTWNRTATDTAAASDAASRSGSSWVRAATDALTLSDTTTGLKIATRSAADVVSIADAAGRLITFNRSATDLVSATDAASATVTSVAGKLPLPLLFLRSVG